MTLTKRLKPIIVIPAEAGMTAREGGNAIGLSGAALAFKKLLSNPNRFLPSQE